MQGEIKASTDAQVHVTASNEDNMWPAVFRAKLGAFEITSILDSKTVRGGLSQSYGGGTATEEIRALARSNLGQYRTGARSIRHRLRRVAARASRNARTRS